MIREELRSNPLRTKQDLANALDQLVRPLIPHYSEGRGRLRLGAAGASYSHAKAETEGFSRVLWGLVPLLAGGGDSELRLFAIDGFRHGANPEHEDYWGEVADYDQLLVEMAAFGFALTLAADQLWEPLAAEEKRRLYEWLKPINDREAWDCNWLFFQVMVSLGFKKAGLPYDRERMERNLERIERFYMEDGWYQDGIDAHCDYYGPFALHFYGLIYAVEMEREDPERSARYKERAALFARDFLYWFAEDGAALPYGRSMAYRFSQSAFWGALVYAGVEALPLGVMKGLLLRNMRWWLAQPIFHGDGTLSIGYAYPNLVMAENYNAPGSPYWALKSFLPLALADDHPFWLAEEEPLPKLDAIRAMASPRMLLHRSGNHVAAFNAGCRTSNEHTHVAPKYEKFVYSTAFGFSVPRAEWGLAQGAYDSMLALSEEGDNLYRVKRRIEEHAIKDGVLFMRWLPWPDVEVRTWLAAGLPWHVRVHRIESKRRLDAADGGFAAGIDRAWQTEHQDGRAAAVTETGISGVVSLHGWSGSKLVLPNANTNLLHPRTILPTLTASLAPGVTWLVSAVYGEPAARSLADGGWSSPPRAEWRDGELIVRDGGVVLLQLQADSR
ncbi:DUF2264 domain-containing protein [Paenibacillus soyae]|uniref:DUF2264 domain-containing protein n=1 Tax=Paenibacillus soyae TaxID=2969249 RepID=A0A9X2MN92_9BACL|nr:DUF2264 domain-containing protein [Paenibacillus soyae]MCR2803425.1 DUF2264 domain-containing protein [Paenibacillus soyae]